MTRRVALGLLLFVGLLVGLTLEPDSGTAASLGLPDVTGATVGANHAKPLPRITTVTDVVRTSLLTLVVLLVLTQLSRAGIVRVERDDDGRRSVLGSRRHALRGPPALVRG
jgi:hypothetical protein